MLNERSIPESQLAMAASKSPYKPGNQGQKAAHFEQPFVFSA
jgi:hypothetical protein